jgi:DNA polymerase III subunit alpha
MARKRHLVERARVRAGSVVAYTLGITSIDPLANGLIFERFLNPGRVSMPDIDLDYPDDARHWMVAYSKRRYGSEKVAQIITFGTLGARAAIRDVGRAMEMPLPEVDAWRAWCLPSPVSRSRLKMCWTRSTSFIHRNWSRSTRGKRPYANSSTPPVIWKGWPATLPAMPPGSLSPTGRCTNMCRSTSRPTATKGLGGVDRVTQWPMEVVESIGLLKVDFLGLSTLTVMRRAAKLIEERYGTAYTMDNIPYDEGHVGPDPTKKPEALFDMLGEGDVAGVFQVEGAGMRRLMMEMKPRRFDHIIAAISLYRPGPMENIPNIFAGCTPIHVRQQGRG